MTDKEGKINLEEFAKLEFQVRSLLQAGRFQTAGELLEKLRKIYRGFSPYLVLWGDYFRAKKDFKQAEKTYIKAIDLDIKNKNAYISLAMFYDESLKQYDKVDEVLWAGVYNSGDPLFFYYYLEMFHVNIGNEEKAIEVVKAVEKEYKDKGELYYKKAEAAYALGLFIDAIDLCRQSLDKGYTGTHHYFYLANCFAHVNLDLEAIDFLKKAIIKNPDNYSMYDKLFELNVHKIGTGDQDLKTAINIKLAIGAGSLKEKVNLLYLVDEADYKYYLDYLDNYLKIDLYDLKLDYRAFCEFYKNLVIFKPDFKDKRIDLRTSLYQCLNQLTNLNDKDGMTLYEGWLAIIDEDYDEATLLFQKLHGPASNAERELFIKARDALAYIEEAKKSSQVMPGKPQAANLGDYLTLRTEKTKFSQKIGMEKHLTRIVEILGQAKKNSILLTGPSGAGKTEIIHQLANLIVGDRCPEPLEGYDILQTSTARLVSGAKYIGVWESRLEELCNKFGKAQRTIIYFEDIENIAGAGKTEGSSNTFLDYLLARLEQNEIIIMGEMDSLQADKFLWDKPRLERLINRIEITPPARDELPEIMKYYLDQLDKSARGDFLDAAITEVIDLTETFMPYKAFPGKAVDLLGKTIERHRSSSADKAAPITSQEVISVFSEITGVPEFILDREQFLELADSKKHFETRILGQDDVLSSIINAVTTFKARLSDTGKPIRSFLFVGPTGVGKTESARVLAEYIFGSQDSIIQLNMSEYNDYNAVSKMIGSHVGQMAKSSKFIDKVRISPFSIVLLDEIEKAHHDVLNILLQLLDDGRIFDAEGKPAYFQSSIIIMTSNLGSRHYTKESIGFGQEYKAGDIRDSVLTEVKNFFSPEIYNRFDEVLCFNPLTKDVLSIIVNREIGKVLGRKGLIDLGVQVDIDPLVKDYIIEIGYDPKYGARHIKRAVERAVSIPLARLIATSKLDRDDQIRVNLISGRPEAVKISSKSEQLKDIAELTKASVPEIDLTEKGAAGAIDSLKGRIDSLKEKFHYKDIIFERDELQEKMTEPTFWDKPEQARMILKRFAEINQKTERMHKWDRMFTSIKSSKELIKELQHPAERSRTRSQVISLMKDLESAEMEILLEGKYDFADAFVIIQNDDNDNDDVKWLLEMGKVYVNWSKRRGYSYRVFGEQHTDKNSLFIYIGGMNAFGLLKNERGLHRKTIIRKSGSRVQKHNCDCMVHVLADVQSSSQKVDAAIRMKIEKLKNGGRGWWMKSLTRKVSLKDRNSDIRFEIISNNTIDKDRNLPGDMFLSYLHYYKKRMSGAGGDKNIWGSLIRTYETGENEAIVDHRTRIIIKNIKDYLGGKIDSLLLERII